MTTVVRDLLRGRIILRPGGSGRFCSVCDRRIWFARNERDIDEWIKFDNSDYTVEHVCWRAGRTTRVDAEVGPHSPSQKPVSVPQREANVRAGLVPALVEFPSPLLTRPQRQRRGAKTTKSLPVPSLMTSLQAAISRCGSGKTLDLDKQVCEGPGTISIPMTLRSSAGTVVRMLPPTNPGVAPRPLLTIRNADVELIGLTFQADDGDAILVQADSGRKASLTLRGCTIDAQGRGVLATGSSVRVRLEDCYVGAATGSAISVDNGTKVIISGSLLSSGRTTGLAAGNQVTVEMSDSSASECGGHGLHLGEHARVFMDSKRGVTIARNGGSGILIGPGSTVTIDGGDLSGNGRYGVEGTSSTIELLRCRTDGNAMGDTGCEGVCEVRNVAPVRPPPPETVKEPPPPPPPDTPGSAPPLSPDLIERAQALVGRLRSLPALPGITLDDPRFHWVWQWPELEEAHDTLSDLVDHAATLPPSADRLERLGRLADYIEWLAELPLQDELADIVARVAGDDDQPLVLAWLGWEGRPAAEPAEVADWLDCDERRVELAGSAFMAAVGKATVWTPALDRLLAAVAVRYAVDQRELDTLLTRQAAFTDGSMALNALADADELLSRVPNLEVQDDPDGATRLHRRPRPVVEPPSTTRPPNGERFVSATISLGDMVRDISAGVIGLPDLQRPFVWKPDRVRDLFDSMYQGFPVGYLLLWDNPVPTAGRAFGADVSTGMAEQSAPARLVVDGQQRLTSIWATVTGQSVIDADFALADIRLAFDPLVGTFTVANRRTAHDGTLVPDIAPILSGEMAPEEVAAFMFQTNPGRWGEVDRTRIRAGLDRLAGLRAFPLTGLVLSDQLDVEQVADIFVRINSKGVRLDQGDFVLTLMSVYWDEGRKQLEAFCRSAQDSGADVRTARNPYITPRPTQLLTVAVSLAFRNARLKETHTAIGAEVGQDEEGERFQRLMDAQAYLLDLGNWHDFFAALRRAGYVSGSMITSSAALLYSYAFFLIGRRDYDLNGDRLAGLIGRWLSMSILTGRYSSGANTKMDADLARLRGTRTADDFVRVLEREIGAALTNDFWQTTLPAMLEATSTNQAAVHVWDASMVARGATALDSTTPLERLFDPGLDRRDRDLKRVPLFPKARLAAMGVTEAIDQKQVANLAIASGPITEDADRDGQGSQSIPIGWQSMPYDRFLMERRRLIASSMREWFVAMGPG